MHHPHKPITDKNDLASSVASLGDELAANPVLQSIIDQLPFMILWKDRNLVYRGCNQLYAQVKGFASPADVIGLTDFDISTSPAEAARIQAQDHDFLGHQVSDINEEESYFEEEGRQCFLLRQKIPLRASDGTVLGMMVVHQNVSAYCRARTELEALRNNLETNPSPQTPRPNPAETPLEHTEKLKNLDYLGNTLSLMMGARESTALANLTQLNAAAAEHPEVLDGSEMAEWLHELQQAWEHEQAELRRHVQDLAGSVLHLQQLMLGKRSSSDVDQENAK